jgi:hypothetical protein
MHSDHLETWEMEQAWERGDAAWAFFVAECERLLGLPEGGLDGDEASGRDCFSLDSAHDAFRAGSTPQAYVAARAVSPRGGLLLAHRAGILVPQPPAPGGTPPARPCGNRLLLGADHRRRHRPGAGPGAPAGRCVMPRNPENADEAEALGRQLADVACHVLTGAQAAKVRTALHEAHQYATRKLRGAPNQHERLRAKGVLDAVADARAALDAGARGPPPDT